MVSASAWRRLAAAELWRGGVRGAASVCRHEAAAADEWCMAKAKAATSSTARVTTLKKRAEYLRVRKGARCATPAFVLEGKARSGEDRVLMAGEPRFGFTITRQVGKAVERNRIRRRLKAAIRDVGPGHAKGDFDYVLIARRPALTSQFAALVNELTKAFARVHRAPPARVR